MAIFFAEQRWSHAHQSAIISLAEDQSALQVEGRAVAADCGPD